MNPKQVELVKTAFLPDQLILEGLPQIAFAGRSNVGKSSLLNRLFNKKNLAKVSGAPGKTRSINYYQVDKQVCFVDLPGYGYAKIGKVEQDRWKKLLEEYFQRSSVLTGLAHLIDIRHEPTDLDIMLHEWTQPLIKHHLYILTKSDKIAKGRLNQSTATVARTLGINQNAVITFSIENGDGRQKTLQWVEQLLKLDEKE